MGVRTQNMGECLIAPHSVLDCLRVRKSLVFVSSSFQIFFFFFLQLLKTFSNIFVKTITMIFIFLQLYIILGHHALHCTVPPCTTLHCTAVTPAVHCTALHSSDSFTAIHCTALHCTALHWRALQCSVPCTPPGPAGIYDVSLWQPPSPDHLTPDTPSTALHSSTLLFVQYIIHKNGVFKFNSIDNTSKQVVYFTVHSLGSIWLYYQCELWGNHYHNEFSYLYTFRIRALLRIHGPIKAFSLGLYLTVYSPSSPNKVLQLRILHCIAI